MTNKTFNIPALGKLNGFSLEMGTVYEAEARLIEAKLVNPSTYLELESLFNESYRTLKRHYSTVVFQLLNTEKVLGQAKADVLLDKYPQFLENNKKTKDSADIREAFLMRDEEYLSILDRQNQLKAFDSLIEGKIKVMERVCAYMKQQMRLIEKSGLTNRDLYITSGKR